MCGRYYIAEDDQAEELKQIIDMINRKHNGDGSVKTAGEIFPSEKVPVITTSRAQKIIPFPMEWGYGNGPSVSHSVCGTAKAQVNLLILLYLLIIPKSIHRKAYTPRCRRTLERQKSTTE